MKVKLLTLGIALGAALLGSCDDGISLVGPSIQPDRDKINVFQDTIEIQAYTVLMDSIYAKTSSALLGEFYDPTYGNLKSDYVCQFYCPEEYQFQHTPLDEKIDSMAFQITYSSWVGDSLAPMQAQIFQVTKPLERNYYTNVDPKEFCDMKTLLGTKTYTAYDVSIPDSIRNITDQYDENYYVPKVRIRMPKELGQKFYDESVNNPATFNSQEAFNNFFPGLYVTTNYGTGNLLNINRSSLFIYYRYKTKSSATNNDTIISTYERFNSTTEVIQLNSLKNGNLEQLLQPNDEYTYMKTPAGVCTKLEIPVSELKDKLEGRIINNLPFKMTALAQEDWEYALSVPKSLLLLPEDSVKTFFESGKIQDSQTSYVGDYTADGRTYDFKNISRVFEKHLENNPDEPLRLLVIPVENVTETSNSYYDSNTYTTAINNYMSPSGVKLKKDKESRTLILTSSKYNE